MDEQIIAEVKQHGVLYDPSLPDYKNVIVKNRVWKDIAFRLGVSDNFVKTRWRNLRDTYKRNKQKFHLRWNTAASGERTPKWKYYYLLNFLDDYVSVTDPIENLDLLPEDSSPATPTSPDACIALSPIESLEITEPPAYMSHKIQEKFAELLNMATEKISENASRSSTSVLFKVFAERVQRANLTDRQIILIENAVCQLVSNKLEEFTAT